MFHRLNTSNFVKILRCALYSQLSSRCLDILVKHCLSCLIYYLVNLVLNCCQIRQRTGMKDVTRSEASTCKMQSKSICKVSEFLNYWDGCQNFLSWTLFLCWHFLLFQYICLAARHVSEKRVRGEDVKYARKKGKEQSPTLLTPAMQSNINSFNEHQQGEYRTSFYGEMNDYELKEIQSFSCSPACFSTHFFITCYDPGWPDVDDIPSTRKFVSGFLGSAWSLHVSFHGPEERNNEQR